MRLLRLVGGYLWVGTSFATIAAMAFDARAGDQDADPPTSGVADVDPSAEAEGATTPSSSGTTGDAEEEAPGTLEIAGETLSASAESEVRADEHPVQAGNVEVDGSAGSTVQASSASLPAAGPVPDPVPVPVPVEPAVVDIFFNASILPPVSINHFKGRGRPVRNHLSLGLLWSRAYALDGFGLALGVNAVEARSSGAMVAMVGNLQLGKHQGVQIAHGFNYAHVLHGAQFASVNVASEVRGAQLGTVNVAGRVRGVQIGLINIADEADASIGLIAVTKKGGFRPELWTSDTALVNVGFRLPAKYTYTFVSAGFHPIAHDSIPRGREGFGWNNRTLGRGEGWELGAGFGGHIPLGSRGVFVDIDLAGYAVATGYRGRAWSAMNRLRLLVGWQVAPRFAIYGGPTVAVQYDDPRRPVARPGYGWVTGGYRDNAFRVRVWPGFAAGLRF